MEQHKPIPVEYLCQISGDIMVDPVLDIDGHSYDRKNIEEWLRRNPTAPNSRSPMTIDQLRPNRAIKDLIEIFLKKRDESPIVCNPELDCPIKMDIIRNTNGNVLVVLTVHDLKERAPVKFYLILDTSGSMSDPAAVKDESNKSQEYGFSVLDLAKHTSNTCSQVLSDIDRFCFVVFSNQARIVLPPTKMNSDGKKIAESVIKNQKPGGGTNLDDGYKVALENLKDNIVSRDNNVLFLLTDGQPNTRPPEGEESSFTKNLGDLPVTLFTFGFGSDMDSKLLSNLSRIGGGSFVHINDTSGMSTAIVNALSTALSIVGCRATLKLIPLNGASIRENELITRNPVTRNIGFLQSGQDRQLIVDLVLPRGADPKLNYLNVTLRYQFQGNKYEIKQSDTYSDDFSEDFEVHSLRYEFIESLGKTIDDMKTMRLERAISYIHSLIDKIETSKVYRNHYIRTLLENITDQIFLAIRQEYFRTWGEPYLRSLIMAHVLQFCNNFKDPSVQEFGGEMFHRIKAIANSIFNSIDLPPPSLVHRATRQLTSVAETFNNSSGPCFHGKCLVTMNNGKTKNVEDIIKGDILTNGYEVQCIVKTHIIEKKLEMVQLNSGLRITPWHPIYNKEKGKWIHPIQISNPQTTECEAIYSFVLKEGHTMKINSVTCITLGHGYDVDILLHEYFGTNRIIDDLKKMSGWDQGLVELQSGCMIHDDKTGLISGIRHVPIHEVVVK